MPKIVVACECCGLPGTLVEAGSFVRVRCVRHEYVMDADEWLRVRSEMTSAFATEAALMSYFLRDYGAGVDLVRALQRDPDETDSETMH